MKRNNSIMSPFNYGGIELKNRIIFAPTTMGLRREEYLAKLEDIASGGCAMIIIGDVPAGKSRMGHSLFSRKGFRFYSEIAEMVHRHGCLLCAQLHQSDTRMSGMFRYIPGMISGKITKADLRGLVNQQTGEYITSIPEEEVRSITSSFGDAAVMAKRAGFDMVQVHGDRMCGSFSSVIFNHRSDSYGGSAVKRAEFARECVVAVKESVPDMPIDFKLAVRQESPHYGNAGVIESEIPTFVAILEEAGVTSFHVTLADHSRLEDPIPAADHPEFGSQGCFLKFCDEVRKCTDLPVCGVGALSDPEFVEEQISSGRIDCAAMSRQLIADPQWVNKVLNGTYEKIRVCRRCNEECLGGMYSHRGVHCIYDRA